MKFRDHKYTWIKPFDQTRHTWSLRGPKGGVSFHVSLWEGPEGAEKHAQFGGPNAGLEFHRAFDPSGGERAADHARCWLLEAPCWHDGTSLYANETVWPMVQAMMPDHDMIFRLLEREYEDHFRRMCDGHG